MKTSPTASILGIVLLSALAAIADVAPRPLTAAEKRVRSAEHSRLRKELSEVSAADLLARYKAGDADIAFVLSRADDNYQSFMRYHARKSPGLEQWVKPATALLAEIAQGQLKVGDEKVSLRPEFERVGVVAHQQTGDTCFQHATYHMYQYQCRAKKLRVPSYEQFVQSMGGMTTKLYLVRASDGRRLMIQNVFLGGITPLEHELVKHLIRNGHPCMISLPKPAGHGVLAIGFEVKDGVTTFEYLDSNRVWQDKGFRTVDAKVVTVSPKSFSAWLK